MLSYNFLPERDRDQYPEVHMSWEDCEDLDIYEHVKKFKDFLRALTFTEATVDRIVVLDYAENDSKVS